MACNTSITAILKGCDNNMGGVKNVYLSPSEFVSGVTVSAGTVTSITMSGAVNFVQYEFNKNAANYVEAGTISLENGSTYFATTLNMMIPRREVAKRNSIMLIAAGQRPLKIIIEDQNGLFWYMGYANSANLTAVGEGSGAAKADGSKYSLTFLAEEPDMMYEIDPTIITAIIS